MAAGKNEISDSYPGILLGDTGIREQLAGQLWQVPLHSIISSRFPLEQLGALAAMLQSDLSSWAASGCQGPKPNVIMYHSAGPVPNIPPLPWLAPGQPNLDRGSWKFDSPNAAQLQYLPSLAAPTVASCAPKEQTLQLQTAVSLR